MKINLSYVKGKKQNFEISENGRNAMQDFTIVTGGVQSNDRGEDTKKNDQSEMFTKWSQLTSDEDDVLESVGKPCIFFSRWQCISFVAYLTFSYFCILAIRCT